MGNENHASMNPCWPDFLSMSRGASSRQPERTTIVLCNNLEDSVAERCLRGMGLEYVKLGGGVKEWDNTFKSRLMEEYLVGHSGGQILYIDSKDVVVVGDLSVCDTALERLGCGMLFSAEEKFYPRCATLASVESFERSVSPNEYFSLNAGCLLADAGFLKEAIGDFWKIDIQDHVRKNKGTLASYTVAHSDQFRWHLLYERYHPQIRLDHGCELFQTTFMHTHADFEIP